MLRTSANLLLSVLLVATLLWGGCVACPQFFQPPLAKNSCCDPAGRCKRTKTDPSRQEPCQFEQLKLQQKVKPPVLLIAAIHPLLPAAVVSPRPLMRTSEERLGSRLNSPHERLALLSTFLI
jgi:hypothetical protein